MRDQCSAKETGDESHKRCDTHGTDRGREQSLDDDDDKREQILAELARYIDVSTDEPAERIDSMAVAIITEVTDMFIRHPEEECSLCRLWQWKDVSLERLVDMAFDGIVHVKLRLLLKSYISMKHLPYPIALPSNENDLGYGIVKHMSALLEANPHEYHERLATYTGYDNPDLPDLSPHHKVAADQMELLLTSLRKFIIVTKDGDMRDRSSELVENFLSPAGGPDWLREPPFNRPDSLAKLGLTFSYLCLVELAWSGIDGYGLRSLRLKRQEIFHIATVKFKPGRASAEAALSAARYICGCECYFEDGIGAQKKLLAHHLDSKGVLLSEARREGLEYEGQATLRGFLPEWTHSSIEERIRQIGRIPQQLELPKHAALVRALQWMKGTMSAQDVVDPTMIEAWVSQLA